MTFLKQKRDLSTKARTCADRRPQQEGTTKQESSSPTASLESIVLTSAIDAMEGQDVATIDIPNAFMQTDLPDLPQADPGEQAIVKMRGKLALTMVQTDPHLC